MQPGRQTGRGAKIRQGHPESDAVAMQLESVYAVQGVCARHVGEAEPVAMTLDRLDHVRVERRRGADGVSDALHAPLQPFFEYALGITEFSREICIRNARQIGMCHGVRAELDSRRAHLLHLRP